MIQVFVGSQQHGVAETLQIIQFNWLGANTVPYTGCLKALHA